MLRCSSGMWKAEKHSGELYETYNCILTLSSYLEACKKERCLILMNHGEQRIWLIRYLLNEDQRLKNYQIPKGEQEQKDLLRALMNVRMPDPISEEVLKVQDEYLSEEAKRAGITDIEDLQPCAIDGRLYLWQGDITTLKVDAITNPANAAMLGCFQPLHNCADNIIGSKAGIRLRLKCHDYMCRKAETIGRNYQEPTGQAMITPGYNLPCRYILHTVGPIVNGQLTKKHEDLLESCYRSCLDLADENGLKSIAFCCISTGVFMFPNERAAEIAVRTVRTYREAQNSDIEVIFNVWKDIDYQIYRELLG